MCFVFARIWTLQVLQMFVRFYACSLPSQSFSFYIFAFIQWIFNDNIVETSSRLLGFFFGKYVPACFLFRQCLKQEINHRFERVFLLILLVDKMSLACNFFFRSLYADSLSFKMHLYKAHLPIRHLLNNRDFEQSNPSTRTQMSALSFYEYIEIISAHCVNTWIMNFSTCGRWPTVDCTFSNGWYSRHVSNAHVSVCRCVGVYVSKLAIILSFGCISMEPVYTPYKRKKSTLTRERAY